MAEGQDADNYQVIIVECCENCESHQSFSRHSEWKYFQQFNELKRKLQRFVNNTIVIKNPLPDQLVKPSEARLTSNTYLNKQSGETVTFPRIGAFQIYIYNVLIYSKLLTNNWPNHYKLVQIVTKIIQAKKQGQSLEQFSVFKQSSLPDEKAQKIGKEANNKNQGQKKKKKDYRVYKSKDKPLFIQSPVKKPAELDPILSNKKKLGRRTLLQKDKLEQEDFADQKNGNRKKLPSLRNTINFSELQPSQSIKNSSQPKEIKDNIRYSNNQRMPEQKQQSLKKIFNSIQKFDKSQPSFIRNNSIEDHNNFNSRILQRNQSLDLKIKQQKEDEDLKLLQDRSVQYSDYGPQKDFLNRSIQYEQFQGQYCDYGIQMDDGSLPKEKDSHYVQTEKVEFVSQQQKKEPLKPFMLDQQIQVIIALPKNQKDEQVQTVLNQTKQQQSNTQIKVFINRGYQFPEQEAKVIPKEDFNTIDSSYAHIYQKRRNIVDNSTFFSVDKFQQKSTKYKWIGRAQQKASIQQIRRNFMYQCLVFCYYNYFGIKTPQKRLSLQTCSNVVVDQKTSRSSASSLVHIMTADNPQFQYFFQFQEYDDTDMKYPLSEILTFKNSKQKIKFTNYGAFLALAYFLGDQQIFLKDRNYLAVIISNQQVKQIFKMSADNFELKNIDSLTKNNIIVEKNKEGRKGALLLDRATQQIQIQFISMIAKITDPHNFTQMLKYFEQAFIHFSPSHKTYRDALLSMKTQQFNNHIIQQFFDFLKARREKIIEMYKGEIYSYKKYKNLKPRLVFSLQNYTKKLQGVSQNLDIDRKFLYNDKIVYGSEIQKHIRNKDTFVVIYGQSGIGKSRFIESITHNLDLKYGQKLRIHYITSQILSQQYLRKKKTDEILDDYRKQVIVLDELQPYSQQIVQFIQSIYNPNDPRSKPEISFCLATGTDITKLKIVLSSLKIQMVFCSMLPLQIQQIRGYMMKAIQFHNYTDKKYLVEQLIGAQNVEIIDKHPKFKYLNILRYPFYLQIYCHYLSNKQSISDPINCLAANFNKYSILKQAYSICQGHHLRQCKETYTQFKDCFEDLKRIAFQYYINNYIITDNIKDTINKYNTNQIIANQLAFYPINIEAVVNRQRDLFVHKQYLYYYLTQAYCFFLQKSYRNLRMSMLYENTCLLSLIKEHYLVEKTHSRLIDVIEKSRKYKSTWEQSSNAITLLNKIGFIFSNYNFDEVQIPEADLTQSVFYNCTFRGSNMINVILYKAQIVNCLVDNAILDNANLYQRKYEIQYTVLSAALSADGKFLALGCGNYLIILQTETGKQIKKIEAHMDIIRSVRYSRDNNTLITIADDKTLRIWDTRSYRSVVFKLPQKGTIAFSSQTDMIASVFKNSLKVWNIKSMANQFILQGHSDVITCLQFSYDGTYIATGSRDSTIKIWSTKKGELLKNYKGHSAQIISAKISPSKKIAASSSKDKDLNVWSLQSLSQISKKKLSDQITDICLDQKQNFITVALSKQNTITVLHLESLDIVFVLEGHKSRILSLSFDISFRKLVSLGRDKTVKIWDFSSISLVQQKKYYQQKKKKLKTTKGSILALAIDKIFNRYATAHQNGEINLFSTDDNRHIDQLISHNGPVTCIQFDKSGKLYSAGSDGPVRVWNLLVRKEPKVYDIHSVPVIQMKLNQKNRIIATSSSSQDLVIVDFTGIKIVISTKQQGRVQSIQFSKDQKIMAVGGSQKYIAIYQIGQGGNSINRMQQLGPNTDSVSCMKFHGDSFLISALKNGQVLIWNHLRSTLSKKIENSIAVTSILSFQKKYVCFASDDGKLRAVDMDEGKEVKIFRLPEKSTSIALSTHENLIYESTANGNIAVWNLQNLKQKQEKIQFDRIAFDQQGIKVVQIEGPRDLLIRNLHFHQQQAVKVKQISSDIQGVTFYKQKIILLLKNGAHWELGKKQFSFGNQKQVEGDIKWLKDKNACVFFKTPIRKLKGIKKPLQSILQDLTY